MTTTARALEALLTQIKDQSHVQPDEPILLNDNRYSLTALRGENVIGMVSKHAAILTIHDPAVPAIIIDTI